MTYTQEMSNMALTIKKDKRNSVDGSRITVYRNLKFTGTYPAGGEPFDANATAGLKTVESVTFGKGQDIVGLTLSYDFTNKKIQLLGESTEASGNEVQPPAAAAAGGRPLIEVANGFDATGITALEVFIKGTRS